MEAELKKNIFGGISWKGWSDILQQIFQILFTIFLARLLTKGDFGLVAMALLVNRFVKSVTNASFGTAIIQNQTITENQISAIFYIQLALNSAISITVYLCADYFAGFFDEKELANILRVMSFLLLVQSFQFPGVLLEKKMLYRQLAIAQLVAMIVANSIAVLVALNGLGVWSLVIRLFAQGIIFSTGVILFSKWHPIRPNFRGLRGIFIFSSNLFGKNILHFFAENIVGLLTGKFLGKEALGAFNIAYTLAIIPSSKLKGVVSSVLTSALSRVKEVSLLRNEYLKMLRIITLFFLPLMVFLGSVAKSLIPLLYGDEWVIAGTYLIFMSLVGMTRGLSYLVSPLILSRGDSRSILVGTFIELLVSLPIMFMTIEHFGVIGLILAYWLGSLASLFFLTSKFNAILGGYNVFCNSIKIHFIPCCVLAIGNSVIWLLGLSVVMTLAAQSIFTILMLSWYIFRKEYDLAMFVLKKVRP